nr:MAG TPA: hypothetical protein [Caudoviricetes sp.]
MPSHVPWPTARCLARAPRTPPRSPASRRSATHRHRL